ncbi:hypothetical protein BJY54_006880 [Streptomyces nodosus]|nr:hypothetical protein [Streptomyces nodosus]
MNAGAFFTGPGAVDAGDRWSGIDVPFLIAGNLANALDG